MVEATDPSSTTVSLVVVDDSISRAWTGRTLAHMASSGLPQEQALSIADNSH